MGSSWRCHAVIDFSKTFNLEMRTSEAWCLDMRLLTYETGNKKNISL